MGATIMVALFEQLQVQFHFPQKNKKKGDYKSRQTDFCCGIKAITLTSETNGESQNVNLYNKNKD
jgi:hypothetical protein